MEEIGGSVFRYRFHDAKLGGGHFPHQRHQQISGIVLKLPNLLIPKSTGLLGWSQQVTILFPILQLS
jgi:hypothetical protein